MGFFWTFLRRSKYIPTAFSSTTHDNPTGGWDDKRDISHSKGHHQRKANLFPECGIADAYQMQKKSFQDSFDLLLSQIYYLVLGSGFNQEMECKVVLAKLTNRRDKKFAQGLALVNWIDHVKIKGFANVVNSGEPMFIQGISVVALSL